MQTFQELRNLKKLKSTFLLPVTYSENSNLEVWLCAEPYILDVEGKILGRIVHYSLMSDNNMWVTIGHRLLEGQPE